MFQDPARTTTVSHMGGEGAMWLGQQPFTDEKHVFANIGDGTYFHSGFLAIRAAVAQRAAVTVSFVHLVGPRWLLKTSSGKIARAANRDKWLREIEKR